MEKEENTSVRETINQWIQFAIWIVAILILPYWFWLDEKKTLQSTLISVSALLPLFLLLATLLIEVGGYTVRGFILAKEALRERKERIQKEKTAAAMSPLAWRVAARFMDEYNSELVEKSESDLLEMVKVFGANKTFDIAADLADKNILDFIDSVDHAKHANRISVNISDLMVNDDFANYVISLVKENQDMHIE